jgi:Micrococcal nuclease (thermonuclease) homologs
MRVILFLIFCILLNHYVFAEDFTGKVISITDGDTVTVLTDNKQIKVRLAEIDTPEKNQPYGKNAKKALSDFIFGKIVQIKFETIDRYGRTIGKIFLDNQNINKEMVKLGHAWVYIHYARDKTLFALEKEAREIS